MWKTMPDQAIFFALAVGIDEVDFQYIEIADACGRTTLVPFVPSISPQQMRLIHILDDVCVFASGNVECTKEIMERRTHISADEICAVKMRQKTDSRPALKDVLSLMTYRQITTPYV